MFHEKFWFPGFYCPKLQIDIPSLTTPLYFSSIFRCLNSFDIKESGSSDSRVVLYDKKTVLALENPQETTEGNESESEAIETPSPSKKRRKKRKKKKSKVKKRKYDSSEGGCQSCDSIESSPSRYKEDLTWTGYKIKKKRKILQDQKSDLDV